MKRMKLFVIAFFVIQVFLKICPIAAAAGNQKGETAQPTQKRTYTYE